MKYGLIVTLLFLTQFASAQFDTSFRVAGLVPMPEPVSNHAVVGTQVNGAWQLYSFAGIGSGLTYADIHLKAFHYNVTSNSWSTLPDLPDTMGKIAAAASVVKDRIYIVGGYHVFANGDEISSDKLHIFNPQTNSYEPDGAPVPVPIDDQVQAVWRDSLIYVIGGWTNTSHTTAVQIYNPATDSWMSGTPLPNNSDYKAFGASGTIIGDTIYYMGGARPGLNFPVAPELRVGVIDPQQPDSITWSYQVFFGTAGYRMGATSLDGRPMWIGGGTHTYNYNAFAYDGSGVVPPLDRLMIYDNQGDSVIFIDSVSVPIMDLRGVAKIGEGRYIVCGGITGSAEVTDTTWLLEYSGPLSASTSLPSTIWEIQLYPNPAQNYVYVNSPVPIARLSVFDLQGREVLRQNRQQQKNQLPVHQLKRGVYLLYAENISGAVIRKKVVLR